MCHRQTLTGLVVFCLTALGVSRTWAIGPAPSWEPRETVASGICSYPDHFGADRVLAFDHHGTPGIAFFDAANDDLRYARQVLSIPSAPAALRADAQATLDAAGAS